MKLCESGATLAVNMEVTVSKLQDSIEAHIQASLKTAQDPDGGLFPVYLSGKSRDEVSGKTGSGKKFYHTLSEQQLVDCGTVDSACNDEFMDNAFAFCREKWPMHGGQLQLHHIKGQWQGFELQCGRRQRKCHGIQRRVHRRRANSDVGSGTATRVCRHRGIPVLISIA